MDDITEINWEVDVSYDHIGVSQIDIEDSNGRCIAKVGDRDDYIANEETLAIILREAYLISAAPEMYRALQKIKSIHKQMGYDYHSLEYEVDQIVDECLKFEHDDIVGACQQFEKVLTQFSTK